MRPQDERVSTQFLENLLDAESRPREIGPSLIHRYSYSGKQIFHVLFAASRIQQDEQVNPVAGR
ncbi:MAG: hypothetical protein OXF01_09510 [Gemmatimonadetes bacterium]|nr:hypothetical protein [Gemmatimonadota bacterium]